MDQRRALKLAGIGFAAAGIGLAAVAVIGRIMGRMPRATVGATPTALAPLPAATLALERPAATSTEAPVAPTFAGLPESLGLTLAVGALPRGAPGRYEARTRTVIVARAVIAEDPRVIAVVLAHELQHALDQKRIALGLLDPDCLSLEVRGFEAQARVTRLLWPDELPNATALEQHVALVARDLERDGSAGIAARVAEDARYREACAGRPS